MRGRNRKYLALALALLAVCVGLAWWKSSPPAPYSTLEEAASPPYVAHSEQLADIASGSPGHEISKPESLPPTVPVEALLTHFRPEVVLDNPECRVRAGKGASSDLAVVTLPVGEWARFATLGADGILYAAALDFNPAQLRVARHRDGSVLTLLGERYTLEALLGLPPLRPVRIFRDGELMYSNDGVRYFGLAADGSSFFVVEPLAAETSRLIIRDLERGGERHYDVGGRLTPPAGGDGPAWWPRYTRDHRDVMLEPNYEENTQGSHYFYPVRRGDGTVRRIRALDQPGVLWALFASRSVGYIATDITDLNPGFLLSREEFDSEIGDRVKWERVVVDGASALGMELSDDGSHLLLEGRHLTLVNAVTGGTVLEFPREDQAEQLSRMTRILGPAARASELGWAGGAVLAHDQIHLSRGFRTPEGYSMTRFYDIFEINDLAPDGGPSRRVSSETKGPCSPGDHVRQGLQEHDGKLTFMTEVPYPA